MSILSFAQYIVEKLSSTMMYRDRGEGGVEIGNTINRDNRTNVVKKHIPLHKLMPYENSSEKIKGIKSRQTVDSLVNTIKSGKKHTIPPITVMKHPVMSGHYIVLDGHHRYEAHKKANSRLVSSEIVPDKNMKYDVD